MSEPKALFIPLNGEHYDAFASGVKTTEYRIYGPRWNESACLVGRPVTLSRGYGKQNRVTGVVRCFVRCGIHLLPQDVYDALIKIHGDKLIGKYIACIGIDVIRADSRGESHE